MELHVVGMEFGLRGREERFLGRDEGPPSGGFGDGRWAVGEPPECCNAVNEGYNPVDKEHPDVRMNVSDENTMRIHGDRRLGSFSGNRRRRDRRLRRRAERR